MSRPRGWTATTGMCGRRLRAAWSGCVHCRHPLVPVPGQAGSGRLARALAADLPEGAGRAHGVGVRLHDAIWLSLFRANMRMVDRYRVGRVLLADDVAHVHSRRAARA
ncbi:MAG TPA: FAD-dependent monooxygenase [Actinomycetes bacterium]|nr:FAD-dependent monooxygenase [Actinomycetes bacterium]